MSFLIHPVGIIRSPIATRDEAPKQGSEGAPDAVLELYPQTAAAAEGIAAGDKLIILTWFHLSRRDELRVHPRGDARNPLTGVFATRSPDRPNPIGLHRVSVRAISGNSITIGPIEALDGTPVVDIKPVIDE